MLPLFPSRRLRRGSILLAAALGLAPGGQVSAAGEDAIRGWIETERDGGSVRFTGFAEAGAAGEIRYEMTVEKNGVSGRAVARQGGRVRLAPGAPAVLSRSSVSIGAEDGYCVRLSLYRGERLVATEIARPRREQGLDGAAANRGACGD